MQSGCALLLADSGYQISCTSSAVPPRSAPLPLCPTPIARVADYL